MVDELLQSVKLKLNDLDALAYGCGPGSFTGVRMASSVVQGLAVGVNKPIIAISSLQAMAHTFYLQLGYTQIACAFDARMQEVYWGAYRFNNSEWEGVGEECNIAPTAAPALPADWVGAGDGWDAYAVELAQTTGIKTYYPRCYPHAAGVAHLAIPRYVRGEYISAGDALPNYLRNKVTH
jgi:tRNA threonylcarbamoyladenosine biosynthesis protein TsaB